MQNDRYLRHSLIDWFSQEEVHNATIAVVGCGAVGNEVAKNLALLGVGKIDLYDFDSIEIHNLTRSVLFRESDIGQNKAVVAAKQIKELNPDVLVNAFSGDFWDTMSLEQANNYSCIISCVDNFEARIRLNQMCLLTSTNFINTGIDSKYGQVEVFPFASQQKTACYECNLPSSAYSRIQQRYSCGWLKKISYIEKKIPTTIVTSSTSASLAVANALKLIGKPRDHQSRRILIDTFTGTSTVTQLESNHICPGCSSLGSKVSIIKGLAHIEDKLDLPMKQEITIITSDPILVSYRCVECNPKDEDATIVFERAHDYTSDLTKCKKCHLDTVRINITDSFAVNKLLSDMNGKEIPAKFLHFNLEDETFIIDLE